MGIWDLFRYKSPFNDTIKVHTSPSGAQSVNPIEVLLSDEDMKELMEYAQGDDERDKRLYGDLPVDEIEAAVVREIERNPEDYEDEKDELKDKNLDTRLSFGDRLKNFCVRSFLWVVSWFVKDKKNDPVLQTLLKSEGGVMVTPGGTQYVDSADIIRRKIFKKKE